MCEHLVSTTSKGSLTGTLDGTTLLHYECTFLACTTHSLLHQRLGHISKDRLEQLIKEDLAHGVIVDPKSELHDLCEHCIAGKHHCDPFPHLSLNHSSKLFGQIHSDLHGPLPRTPYGYCYWMTLVDDNSRFKRVYLLKKKSDAFTCFKKSDAFTCFKKYVTEVELELGGKVKQL